MKYTQLILLSCGLDSATLATKLVRQDNLECLRGLYIDLGFPASPI